MASKEKERVHNEVTSIKDRLQRVYQDRAAKMNINYHEKLSNALEQREKEIKSNFKTELRLRVAEEVKKKEEVLQKKKEKLEKHIMEQAKQLFA
jgi:hypothetical protein